MQGLGFVRWRLIFAGSTKESCFMPPLFGSQNFEMYPEFLATLCTPNLTELRWRQKACFFFVECNETSGALKSGEIFSTRSTCPSQQEFCVRYTARIFTISLSTNKRNTY